MLEKFDGSKTYSNHLQSAKPCFLLIRKVTKFIRKILVIPKKAVALFVSDFTKTASVNLYKLAMRTLLFLFLSLSLTSFTKPCDSTKFTGRWSGTDKSEIGYITFTADGYASFTIQGQEFGGKDFEYQGKRGSMSYTIIPNTNPIQLDFVITKSDSGEQSKLLCLAKFINDDTMRFALSFDGKRPTEFDAENSIVLTREK